jgi:ribosomal protein S27E
MSDVTCPYCGKEQEINHDDGQGYKEDEIHQQECDCGKTFAYTTSITFSYNASKADCLNGELHKFKPTTTVPRFFTKMRCDDCGEERILTDAEKIIYNIPKSWKE